MTVATIAERHFIFGYGSLICHRSRAITAPSLASKPAIPVVVEHFARTWTARIPHSKQKKVSPHHARKIQESLDDAGGGVVVEEQGMMNQIHGQTAMGIEYAKNKKCSGVLIEVDDLELEYFDKREGGYDRVEIDLLHVWGLNDDDDNDDNQETKVGGDEVHHEILQHAFQKRLSSSTSYFSSSDENEADDTDSESFKVWVYVPKTPIPANRNYPIMQSYVDIILRGCLDYDQNFLIKFLTTTHGWWHHEKHHPNIDDSSILKEEEEEEEKGENDQHHYTWVEDRNDPFYVRADSAWSKEKGTLVDEYLQDHLPLAFTKRKSLDKVLGAMEKYEDEFD